MKLHECAIGTLVTWGISIGHIVRLTKNHLGEVIPSVQFAEDEYPRPVHHNNLEVYTVE